MKVSLNWIRQFIDFELPAVDELVERIGAQLGAVEEVENIGEKYQGVIVARVASCVDHPDSDHMHVCMIDDGGKAKDVERDANGHVQVVCGAPNVREGLMVAWLPPGSTVPDSVGKDPFVLGKRELRGVTSNGMLASPRELALGDNHEGILEIDKVVEPGSDFAAVYKLDDYVIDIENKMFTHRPDCFGALGVAREIAGITGHKFTNPDWYKQDATIIAGEGLELALATEDDNIVGRQVPRFTAVAIQGVEVKPSPLWLQVALLKVGAKPINNIVDLTNFYMLVTGQPLHAYDADKVATGKLGARFARKGEKIALLNGKTIELTNGDMVITDGTKPIGLAGVMGGSETEVSSETRNIILECATFDMYLIRRTSMRHGLFTDAVTRFNKGQSPLQNMAVLAKVAADIVNLTGGTVASQIIDERYKTTRPVTSLYAPVNVSVGFINERLGFNLSADEVISLLENVQFSVEAENDTLTVTAPFWRTDIELREDVVEEVGRLYGFDKLPLELPQRSIKPVAKNTTLEFKQQLREKLAKAGANEVLTYSFVHGDLLAKVGQDSQHAFRVDNALSPDLQYYRLSLMPSLLDKIHGNIKAGYDEFALFEFGKAHIAGQNGDDGLPREDDLAALVVTATDKLKKPGSAYYQAREYLADLLGKGLTFRPIPEDMQSYDITKPYDMSRSAFVYYGETFAGIIGEFKPGVRKSLKLPVYTAGFELDTLALTGVPIDYTYIARPRFPKVTQDITLKVAADLPYADLADFLRSNIHIDSTETLQKIEGRDIYQAPDDTGHKQITFRLEIASYERTLTDKEVNGLLDTVAAAAHDKFGAERI